MSLARAASRTSSSPAEVLRKSWNVNLCSVNGEERIASRTAARTAGSAKARAIIPVITWTSTRFAAPEFTAALLGIVPAVSPFGLVGACAACSQPVIMARQASAPKFKRFMNAPISGLSRTRARLGSSDRATAYAAYHRTAARARGGRSTDPGGVRRVSSLVPCTDGRALIRRSGCCHNPPGTGDTTRGTERTEEGC